MPEIEGRITIERVCLHPSLWQTTFEPGLSVAAEEIILEGLSKLQKKFTMFNYVESEGLVGVVQTTGDIGATFSSGVKLTTHFKEQGPKAGYDDIAIFDIPLAKDAAGLTLEQQEAFGLLDSINEQAL